MADSRALRDGIQAAVTAGFRVLDIEGDNLIIIKAAQDTAKAPWQLRNIMLDIKASMDQCSHVTIRHIYRKVNMAADWLSKYGHSLITNLLTTECESMDFKRIIQEDWVGRTLVRRGA